MKKAIFIIALLLVGAVVVFQGENLFNGVLRGYLGLHGIEARELYKNNTTVFFYEGGTEHEQTVILLHGVGGNALTSWFQLMPELVKRYHVIAPDMFFANLPDLINSGYHVSYEKNLVNFLYDQLNISKASLVGLSFGAWPALQVAADTPDKVEGVVLVSPLSGEANQIVSGLQLNKDNPGKDFYYRIFENPPPVPGLFLTPHWDRTSDVFAALPHFRTQLDIEGRKLNDASSEIKCPVLIIHGQEDRVIPRASFEKLAAGFASGSLLGLEQSGHAVVWDQPDKLLEAVESFLAHAGGQ